MKKIFIFAIVVFALILSGCAEKPKRFQDGYQFGDITMTVVDALPKIQKKVKIAKEVYCAPGATAIVRQLALDVIRTYLPAYPSGGICSMDIIEEFERITKEKV